MDKGESKGELLSNTLSLALEIVRFITELLRLMT